MKYCQQCGNACADGAEVCPCCGVTLPSADNNSKASDLKNVNVSFTVSETQAKVLSDTDKTLRLIAFIFNCMSLAGFCWLLIPLAWMIPMTVVSWGIYKGTRKNTVAFGVCTLIFLNLVGGILLLCSTKDD